MSAIAQYKGSGSFSNHYLKTYLMCKDFHCLPYSGGYFEQPAVYIEAFELISNTLGQYEVMEAKKKK